MTVGRPRQRMVLGLAAGCGALLVLLLLWQRGGEQQSLPPHPANGAPSPVARIESRPLVEPPETMGVDTSVAAALDGTGVDELAAGGDALLDPPAASRRLRIRLSEDGGASLIASTPAAGAPLRQRHVEVAEGLLLVIGYLEGVEHWRASIPDPRVQRTETFGPDGRVSQANVRRLVGADLSFAVPTTPAIERVEIYDPKWTGSEHALDFMASFEL